MTNGFNKVCILDFDGVIQKIAKCVDTPAISAKFRAHACAAGDRKRKHLYGQGATSQLRLLWDSSDL